MSLKPWIIFKNELHVKVVYFLELAKEQRRFSIYWKKKISVLFSPPNLCFFLELSEYKYYDKKLNYGT